MFAWVVIVEDYVYDLVVGEDEGVGVGAVDGRGGGVAAGGEGGEESGDFGADVGYGVEEGAGEWRLVGGWWADRGMVLLVGSVAEVIL